MMMGRRVCRALTLASMSPGMALAWPAYRLGICDFGDAESRPRWGLGVRVPLPGLAWPETSHQ